MIFKKPYAILIKYFRLIHFTSLLFMVYLFYKTTRISGFFNSYIRGESILAGFNYTSEYFSFFMYVSIFVIIVASTFILILMKKKQKPYYLYVAMIVSSLYILGTTIFSYNNILSLENIMLDVRLVRANRDFVVASVAIQFILIVLTAIRAFGFDIRKFDFASDLAGLEISEEDKEEIEVSLSIDSLDPKAEAIKLFHSARYNFVENKVMYLFFGGIAALLIIGISAINFLIINKPYQEGDYISSSLYSYSVQSSYVTNRSFDNKEITDGNQLVVLEVEMSTPDRAARRLDNTIIKLDIGGKRFSPVYDYGKHLIDLGTPYQRTPLSFEPNTYLLVFEVFGDLEIKRPNLVVFDKEYSATGLVDVTSRVRLNPIFLDEEIKEKEYYYGETVTLNSRNFKGDLTIHGISPTNAYVNSYRYCLRQDDCHRAKEVIMLPLHYRYNSNLHSLEFSISEDSNININRLISNNVKFILGDYDEAFVMDDISIIEGNRPLPPGTKLIRIGYVNSWVSNKRLVINLRNQRIFFSQSTTSPSPEIEIEEES